MSYKYITKFTSHNATARSQVPAAYGMPRIIKGFTYHWWGDPKAKPSFDGVVSWLTRPNGNTSAHYVVEAGKVACIVAPYDAAWHAGSAVGNATTIGIECNPRATSADYQAIAELSSQLIDAFGDKLKYRHSYWTSTTCPGVYNVERIDRDSYKYISGKQWGDVKPKKSKPKPTPAPEPPKPKPTPPKKAEWLVNLKNIKDTKLTVLPAKGVRRVNLITGKAVNDVIPKGTKIDIAKETTVKGTRYYISSYSAKGNVSIGLEAKSLGIPAKPSKKEKPEWLKNLKDIKDKDMWTRSATPVLSLEDGRTVATIAINTKVRITDSTNIVGMDLLVVQGQKNAIEPVYLNDEPIANPNDDLVKANNLLLKTILALLQGLVDKIEGIFKKG